MHFLPSIGALRRSNTCKDRFQGCCFSAVHHCLIGSRLSGANPFLSTIRNVQTYCSRALRKKAYVQSGMVPLVYLKRNGNFVNVDIYTTVKFSKLNSEYYARLQVTQRCPESLHSLFFFLKFEMKEKLFA